jgi:hypothetical protein
MEVRISELGNSEVGAGGRQPASRPRHPGLERETARSVVHANAAIFLNAAALRAEMSLRYKVVEVDSWAMPIMISMCSSSAAALGRFTTYSVH